jgi:hypothetical protein
MERKPVWMWHVGMVSSDVEGTVELKTCSGKHDISQ